MQVIPAIDLMKGKVVRLIKGDPEKATFYDNLGTPVEMAQKWKTQGAKRLHIIDLDAAFGKPDNLEVVAEIAKATGLPIQVGGGIRNVEAVERLLNAGIQYVILGSLALKDPAAITQLQNKFGPERIIVALDNKDGMVMAEGWTSSTTFPLMVALEEYAKLGVKTFLITAITKDGTLSGPDLDTLNEACKQPNVDIIAAGGIGTLNDLVALSHTGVKGAVVGKALYEGRFTLEQAIKTTIMEQKSCR
jgi:phosphoribosylformimino-5-aminoimidazole carboxamide ribotide isomerase